MIGATIEYAKLKERALMIYVLTDGAVAAGGNPTNTGLNANNQAASGVALPNGAVYGHRSDSGERGASFMLYYDPAGSTYNEAGQSRMRAHQVGAFNNDGAVDTTAAITGASVENLAAAVALNYLSLMGVKDDKLAAEIQRVTGGNPFGQDLENYLVIPKKDA